MFGYLVLLVYGSAVALALYLLYRFHAQHWYWHALAVGIALAIGLMPTPPEMKTRPIDLTIGFVFTFLMIWGLAAPFFQLEHRHRHV